MTAGRWLAALCLCGCAVTPTGGPIDAGRDPAMIERVNALLAGHRGQEAISAWLGSAPYACAAVAPDRRICTWNAGRGPAARSLARAVPTRERVNLICELPSGDRPRDADSCSVHARRSNRGKWKTNKGLVKMAKVERPWEAAEAEEFRRTARAMFESAATPLELSRLIGEGPRECTPIGSISRRCMWYADAETYGHGTLATVIDTHPSNKVVMECIFLSEGEARAPESCVIAEGP